MTYRPTQNFMVNIQETQMSELELEINDYFTNHTLVGDVEYFARGTCMFKIAPKQNIKVDI